VACLYAAGNGGSAAGARDYAVAGLVYFITNTLALDLRAGIGLNERANDVLVGTGFAVRN
jgi:hypothetical protein